jgi:WD40 repeat protein
VQTKTIRDNLKYGGEVVALDITPNGKYLAMANHDIRVWDLPTRKEVIRLDRHRGQIQAVTLRADGQVLASGSADATIKLWNVKTGEELRTIPQRRSVLSLVMTPDSKFLASAALGESTIRLWDASDGREIITLDTFGPLLIGRDGKTLVTGVSGKSVMMWDLADLAGR